jgi:hypothetical protein
MIQSHSCYRYTSGESRAGRAEFNIGAELNIPVRHAVLIRKLWRKRGFRQERCKKCKTPSDSFAGFG